MKTIETSLQRKAMLQKFENFVARMQDDQLKHFEMAMEQVANCYVSESVHSTLLVRNDNEESQSVYAINADKEQVSEMVLFVAEAIKLQQESIPRGQLN